MTAREKDLIAELSEKIGKFCESIATITKDVSGVKLDLYGIPGEKEKNPGLVAEVNELKTQRRMNYFLLKGAWMVVVAVCGATAGAVVTYLLKS